MLYLFNTIASQYTKCNKLGPLRCQNVGIPCKAGLPSIPTLCPLTGLYLERTSSASSLYSSTVRSYRWRAGKGVKKNSLRYYSSSKLESNKLDPYFVTGLTEAEGSFSILECRGARAKFGMTTMLRFKITMLVNEIALLEKVKAFFGVGSVDIDEKRGTVDYAVRDKTSLGLIKKHFVKYPLRGTKFLDFEDFVRALELMEQNLHRSEEGMKLLFSLSEGMNSLRKDHSKMPPVHVIKGNLEHIPLDGNYINGFIAGDGCLYLRTKSNFGSMGIQISQHVNNSCLIREILYYFQPNLNVFTHGKGKKSVQITIGGKKIWNKVIYPHFLNYPMHGSKVLRLKKMLAIANIIESGEHLKRVGKTVVFKAEYKEIILKIWNDDYAPE
uniref:LAGLIDADG endonuclease n=1 Tax=Monilinia fructicola TaxID=38448 RepID=A0A889XPH9_MONFR|nr:LAGLIDADG endonuclease [Monilinia fructicola]QRF72256.1 LAGLIDADG endonuclease [Monilinia fructicola]